jgi:hypothetical protein
MLARGDHPRCLGGVDQLHLSRDDEVEVRGSVARADDRRTGPEGKPDERFRQRRSVEDDAKEGLKRGLTAGGAVF